ncbi:hypothetical protein FJ251_15290 [bacterium]|nr:hypothetical protein [bacterium]
MSRRMLLLALALAGLTLLLGSCSKEHEDLLTVLEGPVPKITLAQRLDPESVQLEWTVPNAGGVDEYRLYVGLYVNLGYAVLDSMAFWQATSEPELLYEDPGLAYVDPVLCEQAGLCDSLYVYTYFCVSAVRGGEESLLSPPAFITP